jgi:hypothetical protein
VALSVSGWSILKFLIAVTIFSPRSTITSGPWFETRSQIYAWRLDKQITFGWINYKVIIIWTNYILVHGTEINMPHWEVWTSWPYYCEELLLGLWPNCCGELR